MFNMFSCPWDTYRYSSQYIVFINETTLNRNYSYILDLYNVHHGWNAVERVIQSILTVKCHKAIILQCCNSVVFHEINAEQRKSQKRYTDWRKIRWQWYLTGSKPKKVVTAFVSSVCVDKMYSSHRYKFAEVTALQNYCHTQPFASRLQSNYSIPWVVSGISIQRTSWPRT
jgi:hypothetical protein